MHGSSASGKAFAVKILFATDGSAEADHAREILGSLPLASGSELLVLSVVSSRESARPEGEQGSSVALEKAQSAADAAAYHLAKAGVSTECHVMGGHPADRICKFAEDYGIELAVLGSRGRSSLVRFFMGSVSYQVAKHARCPVLIVKPGTQSMDRVLLGVDGSEDSRLAVRFLKQFPFPPGCLVTAAHVVHVPAPAYDTARGYYETVELGGEPDRLKAATQVEGKRILEESCASLKGFFQVQTVITAGPPARRLVELAGETQTDLLVVGSRGLTDVERFLMGSVSLQVCIHAPCSVLIVR